jgi:hypothetical protein
VKLALIKYVLRMKEMLKKRKIRRVRKETKIER